VRGEPGKKGVGAERAGQALDDRSDILSTGRESMDINERQRRLVARRGVVPNNGLGQAGLHSGVRGFALAQVGVDVGGLRDRTRDVGWQRREGKQRA
jgi:hypothetical protein